MANLTIKLLVKKRNENMQEPNQNLDHSNDEQVSPWPRPESWGNCQVANTDCEPPVSKQAAT